jgi:putative transposase
VGACRAVAAATTVSPVGVSCPAVPDRDAMDAILLVLRTGMQWNALNATGVCSSSSAHRRFQEWEQAGVFHELWRQGLLEYDKAVGIDWSFLAADGAMTKAPLGGPRTGPNPTGRAKRGRNGRFSARPRGSRSGWHTTAPPPRHEAVGGHIGLHSDRAPDPYSCAPAGPVPGPRLRLRSGPRAATSQRFQPHIRTRGEEITTSSATPRGAHGAGSSRPPTRG